MFTRHVIMKMRPDTAVELALIIDHEIIPLLRQQPGMRHDEAFIHPETSEAVMNSYWDTSEHAEAYVQTIYPEVLKALSQVVEGLPQVETFGVSSSTLHKLMASRREKRRTPVWAGGGFAVQRRKGVAAAECQITERRVGEVSILDMDGEIRTGPNRAALHDAIGRLLQEGRNQILLNLAHLKGIDAGGLGELVSIHIDLNKNGGQLKLLHPTAGLREMMTITKLISVFDIYENEPEAILGFTKPILDREGHLLSYKYARYETHP